MGKTIRAVLIVGAVVSVLLLSACSSGKGAAQSGDVLDLSQCSLTQAVEYDGVSLSVDPAWAEDRQEGICTWTIDEGRGIKLVLTTYADGIPDVELAKCSMHLDHPDSAWQSRRDWIPYEEDRRINFGVFKGTGTDDSGAKMVDYFLSGVKWEEDDYVVASGGAIMLELIYPEFCRTRGEEELLDSLIKTLRWDPSATVLDSHKLGCSQQLSPLDVRGC